jgi:hypothetical protein
MRLVRASVRILKVQQQENSAATIGASSLQPRVGASGGTTTSDFGEGEWSVGLFPTGHVRIGNGADGSSSRNRIMWNRRRDALGLRIVCPPMSSDGRT